MKPVHRVILLAAWSVCAATQAQAQSRVIDLSGRDTTCSPCRDFFQYANGGWVDRTEIPSSYRSYGSFQILADKNRDVLHELLEDAVRKTTASDGTTGLLRTFYGGCMDSARAEADGAKPLAPELARIDTLKTPADVAAEIARLHQRGVGVMFGFGAFPDFKRSTMTIATAAQGGLGLPDRDYYTRDDSVSVKLRQEYMAHIARALALIGTPADAARGQSERVMAIETSLANASMTNVQRRDPNAVYHKMKTGDLRALAPAFAWNAYLAERGLASLAELNVAQPDFFKALNGMLKDVPLDDWKAYLRWHITDDASPFLSSAFVNENFSFQKLLSGVHELLPRWKRCAQYTDLYLGEALGRQYVKRSFPPEAKQRALAMVKNLEAALGDRIAALDWMSDSTKAQARAKLKAFGEKIGYPDHWRDYSKLKLEPGPFPGMVDRASDFESRRRLAQIGKSVDRLEWRMTPPTVNAYYNPSNNDINFPAGILQSPFYDPNADDAVNYGGIGAVIGHEMTHGFDDQGRKFDAQGNLRDWWTGEDARRYKSRSDRIVDQFNGYVGVDTMHVNGKLTLGENTADLGGLAVAYHALEHALEGKPRPLIDGFTPEQRFFLSYANVWRAKYRPEALRMQIATNPHSPAQWRVNGPLSNLPEFAQAWGCKAGDAMVRGDSLQVRIW